MIVEAILTALVALAEFVVGLLPDGDPLGLSSSSGLFVGYSWANTFLPLNETFAALGVYLGVYLAILGVQSVRAALRHVPWVGG